MKKFEIHLDALITIIIVFMLALGFILYQRHQFSIVFQENIDLTWENEKLKVNVVVASSRLEICEKNALTDESG